MSEVIAFNDVRAVIAHQLGVDIKRVTDDAHFTDDLGADWLDRLELMIVIEDQFADVVITDEDVDQIEVVGFSIVTPAASFGRKRLSQPHRLFAGRLTANGSFLVRERDMKRR